jgi:hypothetical protein
MEKALVRQGLKSTTILNLNPLCQFYNLMKILYSKYDEMMRWFQNRKFPFPI